jgi:hypothetical protein
MPALDLTLLKQNIKNNLIAKGMIKYTFDSNGNPVAVSPAEVNDQLASIVDAIAEGVQSTFEVWRASQTVTGTAAVTTAPGSAPIMGRLP